MPEKFKINHYTFGGVEMEDLVHSEPTILSSSTQ